jgi:hypothetical protein
VARSHGKVEGGRGKVVAAIEMLTGALQVRSSPTRSATSATAQTPEGTRPPPRDLLQAPPFRAGAATGVFLNNHHEDHTEHPNCSVG